MLLWHMILMKKLLGLSTKILKSKAIVSSGLLLVNSIVMFVAIQPINLNTVLINVLLTKQRTNTISFTKNLNQRSLEHVPLLHVTKNSDTKKTIPIIIPETTNETDKIIRDFSKTNNNHVHMQI